MLPLYITALTEEYSMMIYTVWKVSETWKMDEWIQRTMTAGMVECLLFRLCAYKQTSKSTKGWEKISSKYSQEGYKQVDWAQNWDLIPTPLCPWPFVVTGNLVCLTILQQKCTCCTEVPFLVSVLQTPTILSTAEGRDAKSISFIFQECILHWMAWEPCAWERGFTIFISALCCRIGTGWSYLAKVLVSVFFHDSKCLVLIGLLRHENS